MLIFCAFSPSARLTFRKGKTPKKWKAGRSGLLTRNGCTRLFVFWAPKPVQPVLARTEEEDGGVGSEIQQGQFFV